MKSSTASNKNALTPFICTINAVAGTFCSIQPTYPHRKPVASDVNMSGFIYRFIKMSSASVINGIIILQYVKINSMHFHGECHN
jgi:hypothetical protein